MRNPLLKYMMKTNREDVRHTSVYGKAQRQSNGVNAINSPTQSYNNLKMNSNKQLVGGYGSSQIVAQTLKDPGRKARVYESNMGMDDMTASRGDAVTSIRANGPKAPGSTGEEKAVISIRSKGPKAPGSKSNEGAITSLRSNGPMGPRGGEQATANLRAQGQARAQAAAAAPKQPFTIHKNPGISR